MNDPQNLPFKLPNPVVLAYLFTRLYNPHCYLISEYFQNPQRNPIPLNSLSPLPSSSGNHFLSVWTCPFRTFHINGTCNPWPLCPAPFTWHHVLGDHPCWGMGQCFPPLLWLESPAWTAHILKGNTQDAPAARSVQQPPQPSVNFPSLLLPPAG